MHEASLMTGLMRRIEEVARASGAKRVTRLSVRLGAFSHLSESHFAEHFARAAAGTIAEQAQLDVNLSSDPEAPFADAIQLESVEVET